jgi:hypothetical protein
MWQKESETKKKLASWGLASQGERNEKKFGLFGYE